MCFKMRSLTNLILEAMNFQDLITIHSLQSPHVKGHCYIKTKKIDNWSLIISCTPPPPSGSIATFYIWYIYDKIVKVSGNLMVAFFVMATQHDWDWW